jgi:hypothetical protein
MPQHSVRGKHFSVAIFPKRIFNFLCALEESGAALDMDKRL